MNKVLLVILLAIFSLNNVSAADDLPKWLAGWAVKGDLRLRLESKDFDSDAKHRDRARFRLRISASKKITDQLKVSLRFASGTGDPTSTNETFDNSFSGKDWNLDRAHLQYQTNNWTLHGGKMSNILHSSDLVWDTDVNPEGFFQQYKSGGFYATLGELFLEENSSGNDVNLYTGQIGFKGGDDVKYDISAAYYSYNNADGFLGTNSDSYDFVDLLATIKLKKATLHFDYVKNTSSFEVEIAGQTIDNDDADTAWAVYAEFGGKKPGQWDYSIKYAELQAASSYTILSDSDFGRADTKGFVGHVGYTASKHLGWGVSLYSVDSIKRVDQGATTAQLDCAVKF